LVLVRSDHVFCYSSRPTQVANVKQAQGGWDANSDGGKIADPCCTTRRAIHKRHKGALTIDKLEIVRVAVRELGEANAQDLAAFIDERFNVKIEPRYIPLFKASLRDKDRMQALREQRQRGAESSK
jgi:hypothetical protein